ncbi:MAG: hypothetical protein ACE5D7_07900 [Fidelibacterota bacterium]
MNLADTVKIKPFTWRIIGEKTVTRIVKDSMRGIGQDGEKFKKYSKNYAKAKGSGFKNYQVRFVTHAGKNVKFIAGKPSRLKGVSVDRQTNPPNLRLTGEMHGSLSAQKPTPYGVTIQYGQGEKVTWNKDSGRDIFGVRDKNLDLATKDLGKELDKNIQKYVSTEITYKIK